MTDLLKKSLNLFMRRQTNILSAAFIIMSTVILSQVLGLVRERLLISIFGASSILGAYDYANVLPDTIFQLVIAASLTSAFIPVFSEYLSKNQEKEGHRMASTLLVVSLCLFMLISIILGVFAPFFLQLFNLGGNLSSEQLMLIANLMRIIIAGQLLFIVGTFMTALLQSYHHFFIPGIALAFYNFGIILGIFFLHEHFGIYSAPFGIIIGATIYVLIQIPLARKVGFSFTPSFSYIWHDGIQKVFHLMWPRTIQVGVQQLGTVALAIIIGFMIDPLRMKYLFGLARTLMFAPVSLIGFSIAQAAFPILSREKSNVPDFKKTFITSFNQLLYLILPISVLILVLRVPIVRLVYGADRFDWNATLLTGKTLALFSISIFAQALIVLLYKAFYSLHNTKIPLITSAVGTAVLIGLSYVFVVINGMDIQSVALAFSLSNILQFLILFLILDRKLGGFDKGELTLTISKFFISTVLTGFALYIPIKLLDQLVIDTTRTLGLMLLTGISTTAGLLLYLFLTWLLNIKEASTYIYIVRRLGNWREILEKSDEIIDGARANP